MGTSMIQQMVLVGFGGAIGAILRFTVGNYIETSEFPLSTFIVNIVGSFLLGMLAVLSINYGYSEEIMLFFATGLLGAFTTMSTFSLETITLLKDDNFSTAIMYAGLSFLMCIIFSFVGWAAGERISFS
tara:strand:- start:1116 stop:1502 length:387 start_codon:yes stop_codon:yes gene_type:complete